jgi:hypothetical protein
MKNASFEPLSKNFYDDAVEAQCPEKFTIIISRYRMKNAANIFLKISDTRKVSGFLEVLFH